MEKHSGTLPSARATATSTPAAMHAERQLAEAWARVRGRLRDEVGEVEYRTWLRQMTLAGVEGDEAIVQLPTRFLRDWVRGHYGDRLRALWQQEFPGVRRVEVRVARGAAAASPSAPAGARKDEGGDGASRAEDGRTGGSGAGLAEPLATPGHQADARTAAAMGAASAADARAMEWAAPLDARFTFDRFVVGKPNEGIVQGMVEFTGVAPGEMCICGDRLYTDIATGLAHGMLSVCVLSGEAREEDIANSPFKPDLVFGCLADMIEYL